MNLPSNKDTIGCAKEPKQPDVPGIGGTSFKVPIRKDYFSRGSFGWEHRIEVPLISLPSDTVKDLIAQGCVKPESEFYKKKDKQWIQ